MPSSYEGMNSLLLSHEALLQAQQPSSSSFPSLTSPSAFIAKNIYFNIKSQPRYSKPTTRPQFTSDYNMPPLFSYPPRPYNSQARPNFTQAKYSKPRPSNSNPTSYSARPSSSEPKS
jgi:hypothetical protein